MDNAATTLLVQGALEATAACLAAMRRSLDQMQRLLPVTPGQLKAMTLEDADRVAAFLKRFENLVEVSQRQLFRASLVLAEEEHQHISARQVRDRLGGLGLLAEPDDWKLIVEARHRTAHVYPSGDDRAADALNAAFAQAERAVQLIAPMLAEVEARFAPLFETQS